MIAGYDDAGNATATVKNVPCWRTRAIRTSAQRYVIVSALKNIRLATGRLYESRCTTDVEVSGFIYTDSAEYPSGKREHCILDCYRNRCCESYPDNSSGSVADLNNTDSSNRFESIRVILKTEDTCFQNSVACSGDCPENPDNCAGTVERPDCQPFERPVDGDGATREVSVTHILSLWSTTVSGDPQYTNPASGSTDKSEPEAPCGRLDHQRPAEKKEQETENGGRILTCLIDAILSSNCDGTDTSEKAGDDRESNHDCKRHSRPAMSDLPVCACRSRERADGPEDDTQPHYQAVSDASAGAAVFAKFP